MDAEDFLNEYEGETGDEFDSLFDAVYDEFAAFCRENGISIETLSDEELETATERFIQRGFENNE